MFGELSKLFDRNFAIGYFLPVAIFSVMTVLMLNQYLFGTQLTSLEQFDYLISTTVIGLLSWVGGIVLLAVNRDLYRFVEGNGSLNPLKLFLWFEKLRFRRTRQEYEKLERHYQACQEQGKDFPDELERRQGMLRRQLAEEFPDEEQFLLPTPFGNALRSFERFPQVMYGLDAIPVWDRLLGVLPREYIEMLDGAKAQVDFWVNLGLIFVLLQIEYVTLVFATTSQLNWWTVGIWAVLGTLAPLRATSAARDWGEAVKSAFDVFAPKLREALGFEQPKDREEEFAQWQDFSRAMVYRLPDHLPELKKVKRDK